MSYNRREFIQRGTASITALSTLCLCNCASQQLSRAGMPGLNCCDVPDLEPESYTIGEENIIIELSKALSISYVGGQANIVALERSIQMIVVHVEEEQYLAFSRLCTHANQVISYNQKRGILQCNGYNHSSFSLDGEVYKGPAEAPLHSYPVSYADGRLEIVL